MKISGFLLGACLLAAPASMADTGTEGGSANIAGLWTFEADLPEPCSFNGQARLVASGEAGTYRCELTARQHCPDIGGTYVVEQSCEGMEEDGAVTVQSTVRNFLEGAPMPNYLPDHFQLDIDDPASMSGLLIGSSLYPAIWRRANGAIS